MAKNRDFDYQRYLASREWALLKNRVRERAGGVCERCGDAEIGATHHLTYERIGREELTDLLGVCRPCHAFLSGVSNQDPAIPWDYLNHNRLEIILGLLLEGREEVPVPDEWTSEVRVLGALIGEGRPWSIEKLRAILGTDSAKEDNLVIWNLVGRAGEYVSLTAKPAGVA